MSICRQQLPQRSMVVPPGRWQTEAPVPNSLLGVGSMEAGSRRVPGEGQLFSTDPVPGRAVPHMVTSVPRICRVPQLLHTAAQWAADDAALYATAEEPQACRGSSVAGTSYRPGLMLSESAAAMEPLPTLLGRKGLGFKGAGPDGKKCQQEYGSKSVEKPWHQFQHSSASTVVADAEVESVGGSTTDTAEPLTATQEMQDLVACERPTVPALQLAAAIPELVVGSVTCPTVGSKGHYTGSCKPCAFVYKGGCKTGLECGFCHLCAPGAKKLRKKLWKEQQRTLEPQQALAPYDQ